MALGERRAVAARLKAHRRADRRRPSLRVAAGEGDSADAALEERLRGLSDAELLAEYAERKKGAAAAAAAAAAEEEEQPPELPSAWDYLAVENRQEPPPPPPLSEGERLRRERLEQEDSRMGKDYRSVTGGWSGLGERTDKALEAAGSETALLVGSLLVLGLAIVLLQAGPPAPYGNPWDIDSYLD